MDNTPQENLIGLGLVEVKVNSEELQRFAESSLYHNYIGLAYNRQIEILRELASPTQTITLEDVRHLQGELATVSWWKLVTEQQLLEIENERREHTSDTE